MDITGHACGHKHKRGEAMVRPECFEFAMDFLGDPECEQVKKYVEGLESALDRIINLTDSEMADGDGARRIAEDARRA